MRQTTKDAIRVAGPGQAHAMPITQSFMQACKSAYSVYKNRRTREEKVKKANEQRRKDQGEEEAKEQKEAIIISMKRRKRRLEDREKSVSKEQKKCDEQVAEGLYDEANRRIYGKP